MEAPAANRPSVCVVVPLSTREYLTPAEETSLRHLEHFLGGYERCLVSPAGLDVGFVKRDGYSVERFDEAFFGSAKAHSRLLLSKIFYERFYAYEFVLIHHLDSLVFSDQLGHWCGAGYDYLGPPWIRGPDSPWVRTERVGNGGFSLRRVPSFLRVLNTPGYPVGLRDSGSAKARLILAARRLAGSFVGGSTASRSIPRTVDEEIQNYLAKGWNEDGFWARQAVQFDPGFRVASVEVALEFAFEANPRTCFERNNRRLPFGCHAWEHYDSGFWQPLIIEG